jgi:hypothetical protein
MRTVTTVGDLPDDNESRRHAESAAAWNDYAGRILELELMKLTWPRALRNRPAPLVI